MFCVVRGTWKFDDPRLKMSHEGVALTRPTVRRLLIVDRYTQQSALDYV